jgi:hypothetical protein
MKTTSKLAAPIVVMVGIFALVGVGTNPNDLDGVPAPAPVQAGDHRLHQLDADMTQRMSTPTADGPMQTGATRDAQLDSSGNAAYLAQLEQHQRDIQRMLAAAP